MIANQVRAFTLAFLGAVWICSGPRLAAQEPEPWDQEPHDQGEESEEPDSPERPAQRPGLLPLTLVSEVDLGSRVVGPALSHDQDLVVATASGEVVSLDAAAGKTKWRLGMPGAVLYPPSSLPFGILVASRSGKLSLLRPENGAIQQERSLDVSLALPPMWNGRTLFFATPDAQVLAYGVEPWKELWRSKLQGPPLTMSLGAGLVLISDRSGGLHALEASTGNLRWQFQGRGNFEAAATFDPSGERIYLGDTAGFFYAISVQEGKVHYRWATGAAITHPALLEEDRLFVASYANTLFCYRTGNGHELWRANLPGRPAAAPVRSRRRIVVLTLNGQVVEYAAGGQPGAQIYASPDDVLPHPTFVSQGMALPLRSGRLLLLRTRQPSPSEAVEPGEGEPMEGVEDPEEPQDMDEDSEETNEPNRPSATRSRTGLSTKGAANTALGT